MLSKYMLDLRKTRFKFERRLEIVPGFLSIILFQYTDPFFVVSLLLTYMRRARV